ncbi:MAG: hypothetical protein AAFY48_06060 [Bacteroidota bacterium]
MQVYNRTDRRLHQLAQLLAKASRSYVPKEEDDSHTNLYFDAMGQRLLTHSFGDDHRKLAFSLVHQTFEWVAVDGQEQTVASLRGQSLEDLEASIAKAMSVAGFDGDAYNTPLHYEIPNYGDLADAFTPLEPEALIEWQYYRRLANQVGMALLGYLSTPGQACIWPHHFDTGTYSLVADRMGIGYGLAMQDELVGAPYFYVSAYPQNGKIEYSQARQLHAGHWKVTDGWQGAVLPLTTLPPRHSMRMIMRFVKEAADWYLRV